MPEETETMPPAGGDVSPDEVMEAQDQEMEAQRQAALQLRPEPTESYTYSRIERLSEAIKSFVGVVNEEMGIDFPVFEAPEGETKLDGPIPEEVWLPFIGIVSMVATMPEAEKYLTPPDEMATDTGIQKAIANFGRMEKDKSLIASLQEGVDEEEMTEDMPERVPGEMTQEEQDIMEMG